MPKGMFSAALSGLASLSLFSLVLFVTFKTSPSTGGAVGVSDATGAGLSAVDAAQHTQLLLEYLNAGKANNPRKGLQVVEEASRNAAMRQSLDVDFQRREWFVGFGAPQFTKCQCASTGAGLLCDAAGVIPYSGASQTSRNFTAQFIKTPKGWRVREFIIAPSLNP